MSGRVNTINNNKNNKRWRYFWLYPFYASVYLSSFWCEKKLLFGAVEKIFLWISNVTEHFSTVNAFLLPGKHQAEQRKKNQTSLNNVEPL